MYCLFVVFGERDGKPAQRVPEGERPAGGEQVERAAAEVLPGDVERGKEP